MTSGSMVISSPAFSLPVSPESAASTAPLMALEVTVALATPSTSVDCASTMAAGSFSSAGSLMPGVS